MAFETSAEAIVLRSPTAMDGIQAQLSLPAQAQYGSGYLAFYMGFGDAGSGAGAGDGFWSIRCTDGRSFEVEVHPDGTSNVLECAVLEAVHAGHCFRKFST